MTQPSPTRVMPLLQVAHIVHGCRTLGPGSRTVLWVRGCSRRCTGCIAAPILDDGPVLAITPEELVARIQDTEDEGITISGGEPFEQAEALAPIARALRSAGRSVMIYSGHVYADLVGSQAPAVAALLEEADLLVDGPFDQTRQADLLWRGSSNQRIHVLSHRYQCLAGDLDGPGVGVEIRLDDQGRLLWAGVPPVGFVSSLRRTAEVRGLVLSASGGVWA
ncbi:MAG: radical SAM protein [Oligoflexia bacterium]|nr:radical SAM protein [Oligoflexia bacterium]